MNADEVSRLIESAVRSAILAQKTELDKKIEEVSKRLTSISIGQNEVKPYEEVKIYSSLSCDESLEVIKSLPEFDGKIENYVSWRQAAHNAYKVFEKYDGSSKHYQAVCIIRNKIRGSADAVLASFNTVLNFKAIIARLDFTYADKKPVHLIEQELSTLRQGDRSVVQFYDEVEKKLSLLTNKTIMSYDKDLALAINNKYRQDALRVFVSGLRKPLCDVLFSARAADLPSALALAQEVEANHERYVFATSFANRNDDKKVRPETSKKFQSRKSSEGNWNNNQQNYYKHKNPHYEKEAQANSQIRGQTEPMELDPTSSKFRQPTNYGNANNPQGRPFKRQAGSDRSTGPKFQRVNNMIPENSGECQAERYGDTAESECGDIDDEIKENNDFVNFLEEGPYYRS